MAAALESGVREAQEKINDGFVPLWESWKAMTEKQQEELRGSMADLSNSATGEFKTRLDNVSNTWLLATVAKLDHQSRDVVSGLSFIFSGHGGKAAVPSPPAGPTGFALTDLNSNAGPGVTIWPGAGVIKAGAPLMLYFSRKLRNELSW